MVAFVSARSYLNVPLEQFIELLICSDGNKEVVVLCDDELKEILRSLPSDYFIPRMSDFFKYLTDHGIPFEVGDLKKTTRL